LAYQDWPNSSLRQVGISKEDLMKPAAYCKAIIRGRAIPACHKPELIGIFKMTVGGLKNADKSRWLDKAIPKTLKPNKNNFVFFS
jgi:hypothetical protein